MARAANRPVHSLLIPTASVHVLVPSATIAEVINVAPLGRLPCAPDWCLGVIGWRQRAVPVISLEALLGKGVSAPTPRSKIMVFFPLPGCQEGQFFGVLSTAEPQPHTIDSVDGIVTESPHPRYFAAALRVGGVTAGIPDLKALKATLYP